MLRRTAMLSPWIIRRRFEYLDLGIFDFRIFICGIHSAVAFLNKSVADPKIKIRTSKFKNDSGLEMQDQVDNAYDRQDDLYGNVELADIRMALFDLGGGFKHFVFFSFSHESLLTVAILLCKIIYRSAFGEISESL
jgi:hypothetical protein